MSAVADYYRLLEVRRDASVEVISAAYRRLIRQSHPDTGGDPDRTVQLNLAHETLADTAKRRAYDRTLPPDNMMATSTSELNAEAYIAGIAATLGRSLRRHATRVEEDLERMRRDHGL